MHWPDWVHHAERERTKVILTREHLPSTSLPLVRFAEWIFERLNDTRRNDAQRQLLVGAFRRSLENEHEMLCLTDHIQHICEELKKILESVVHAPLMIVITDTIIDLSRIYPHVFRGVFVVRPSRVRIDT